MSQFSFANEIERFVQHYIGFFTTYFKDET